MTKFTYKWLENEWLKKYGECIHKNIDKIIQADIHIPLFNNFGKHSNLTWEIIENNPDYPWDWEGISENPNITWEIIKNNPDQEWNWYRISSNPNITWEIIENNPDKPWDWDKISLNQNITWEMIENNPDKPWQWGFISINTMEFGKEKWINDLRINIIRTLRLQRYWRYYSSHPEYKLAQRIIKSRLEE